MAANKTAEAQLFNTTVGDAAPSIRSGLARQFGSAMATAEDVDAKLRFIANNSGMMGEFLRSMSLKVGASYINATSFTSVFKRFRRSQLDVGGLIEESYVGFTDEETYDPNTSANDFFSNKLPDVRTVYYNVDRESKYTISILDRMIIKQVQEQRTLGDIISNIINNVTVKADMDEQRYVNNLIAAVYDRRRVPMYEVGNDLSEMTVHIKAINAQFTGENRLNEMGVINPQTNNLKSFITSPYVMARLKVDVLANAFNMDQASIMNQITVVPSGWVDDNILGLLCVDNWFVIANQTYQFAAAYNPDNMSTKYWLHVHEIIANSPFAGAAFFVKKLPKGAEARVIIDKPLLPLGRAYTAENKTQVFLEPAYGKTLTGDVAWKVEAVPGGSTDITAKIDADGVITTTNTSKTGGKKAAEFKVTGTVKLVPAKGDTPAETVDYATSMFVTVQ